MRFKSIVGALSLVAAVGVGTPAQAWYFPEHTELTRLAVQDYAPKFVAATLDKLIDEARHGAPGVPAYVRLCKGVSTRLDAAYDEQGNVCVPYGALAALAGDHTNYAVRTDPRVENSCLSDALLPGSIVTPPPLTFRRFGPPHERPTEPLAVSLTEAAQATWVSFLESAPRDLVEVWTGVGSRLAAPRVSSNHGVNPRDYVRSLDAALFVLDPGYATRAKGAKTHFHDATASLADILDQAVTGDLDNALAQLVAHHLRSLQLAVESGAPGLSPRRRLELRNEALFEHAFALHFVEDGLAAGHVATDPAVAVDERRAQRHDYFNRQGLAVRRSMAAKPCDPFDPQLPSSSDSMGLSPCWVAHGDGLATKVDRAYVTEAAARIQTSFALALLDDAERERLVKSQLDPGCIAWVIGGADAEGCGDLAWTAFLLDPFPAWSQVEKQGPRPHDWAVALIKRHAEALRSLGARSRIQQANAGSAAAQPHVLPDNIFGWTLSASSLLGEFDSHELGVMLVRPVLMAWPAAQTDVTTLAGGDIFHRGWQAQIAVNAAFGWAKPFTPDGATSVWVGGGGGVGYTANGIFPTRVNRTLGEANVGVAQGYYLAGSDTPFRTLGVLELRTPASALILYGMAALSRSRMPLELLGDKTSVGLFGARAYAALNTTGLVFTGWDAEVVNVYLGTPGSGDASLSGITSSELRVRIGCRDASFERLQGMFSGVVFVAAEISSGYYTTLF